MNLYQQVHAGAHCNARMLSSKADFCVLGVAILIFRCPFESWYSMLFFRFSTTKRQSGLSTNQASREARPGPATLELEVGSEVVDGERLPCVDTTHGVARPGVFAGGFARSEWRVLAARAYRTSRACGGFIGPGAACLLVSSLLWGTVASSVLQEVP
jgi:hypothetical protein